MRYFYCLTAGINITPIMTDIARCPDLWDADNLRTTFEGTPHKDVSDILLRFGSPDGDDLEARDLEAMRMVRSGKKTALDVMNLVGGSRLGRVVITRTPPGKRILPHRDVLGKYANYYTRYHLVLHGLPGSLFTCGDETVNMKTGELWWFNAAAEHSVINNSADDRIHMLIDVRVD